MTAGISAVQYLPISFNNPLISILKVSSSSFSDYKHIQKYYWSITINLIVLQNEYTIPNIDEFQNY